MNRGLLFLCYFLLSTACSAQFTLNVTSDDPDCYGGNNGRIEVTPDGGGSPHYYTWSTGAAGYNLNTQTGLSAGTYSVSVSGSIFGPSVIVTGSATLVDPPELLITSLQTEDVSCKGDTSGSAVVTTQGGTGRITVFWQGAGYVGPNNDTATGLAAGNYTLTVSDGLYCTKLSTFTITEPADSLLASIEDSAATCNNLNASLAVLLQSPGSGGVTYTWNTNPTQSTASIDSLPQDSIYSVTVTDAAGCTLVLTDTTTGADSLTSVTMDNLDGTGSVVVTGGVPPYRYDWNYVGNADSTATISLGTNLSRYTVTVTDAVGCTIVDTLVVPLSLQQLPQVSAFNAYPNPNKGQFTLSISFEQWQTAVLTISNVLGQPVYQQEIEAAHWTKTVNLNTVSAGLYVVRLEVEGQVITRTIQIE
jgi:hypothetical protein